MLLDLHVHTCHSKDSLSSLKSIAAQCAKKTIIPAITDHNTVSAHNKLKKSGLNFIPGIEVSSLQGHIIAYYPTGQIPMGLSAEETIDIIKEQGALSCAAHPFDTFRKGLTKPELILKCDMIEVFNSRTLLSRFNEKALAFANAHVQFVKTCGSDAHLPCEVGNAYIKTTEFDINHPKEFINAVKKGIIYGHKTPIYLYGGARIARIIKQVFGKGVQL